MYSYYSLAITTINNTIVICNTVSDLLFTIKRYGIYYGFTTIINGVKLGMTVSNYLLK